MKKLTLFLFLISSATCAQTTQLHQLFTNWTRAFNHRELKPSCNLFSKELTATYRGYPEKNYQTICNGFKKIFADQQIQYQYKFKIHQIYTNENLAAVRITWYLNTYRNNKLQASIQDEGLDVLRKEKDGEWRIVNYLGYEK